MRISPQLLLLSLLIGLLGCQRPAEKVEHEGEEVRPAVEAEVCISPDAQVTIGVSTTKVENRDVRESISATGWLAAKPASEIVVKAPTTGFISPSSENGLNLGDTVTKDQSVGTLAVFLSPQEQAQLIVEKENADTIIEQSQTTARLAEAQLQRIEDGAVDAVIGTRLIELRETIAHARAAEKEAREKLPFLPQEPYAAAVGLAALPVEAPLGGRLVNIFFAPRQFVMQGDPLWTIADWSRLWIHVPVYPGSLSRIAEREPAIAMVPGDTEVYDARPINIPQPTEPGKQTVELLYEIDNQAEKLRPGQALSVSLPSGKQVTETVIPRSAILWDGMGNSWVYKKISPTNFRRQKIELGQFLGDDVVVRRGATVGEEVVTRAAEALYGEEFKGQLQVGDDD